MVCFAYNPSGNLGYQFGPLQGRRNTGSRGGKSTEAAVQRGCDANHDQDSGNFASVCPMPLRRQGRSSRRMSLGM
jgi:hypothetical protein